MALTQLESGLPIQRVVDVNCERERTPKICEAVDFPWWKSSGTSNNENLRAVLKTTVSSGLFWIVLF